MEWQDRITEQMDEQQVRHDLDLAIKTLPERFQTRVWKHHEMMQLVELVMDYGRPPIARYPSGDHVISEDKVTFEDIEEALEKIGDFGEDNRAGIEATLHRISCMIDRNDDIYGLTIRIGRAIVTQTTALVSRPLKQGKSILLLGPPGIGKTTAIRTFCHVLSVDLKKRVVIVDTTNEIAGYSLVPHPAVGLARRMQLKHRKDQHHVMVEAVQNHMPEVVVIDEIGEKNESDAARSISQRGVQLIATAHARTLDQVINDPVMKFLVGGVTNVTIGDQKAKEIKSAKKTVAERAFPSSFDVVVEMANRDQWRIHHDTNAAVDKLLAGLDPEPECRYLNTNGEMIIVSKFESQCIGDTSAWDTRASAWRPRGDQQGEDRDQWGGDGDQWGGDGDQWGGETETPGLSKKFDAMPLPSQSKTPEIPKAKKQAKQKNTTPVPPAQPGPAKQKKKGGTKSKKKEETPQLAAKLSVSMMEAERIINATSSWEALQVDDNITKEKLKTVYIALTGKIQKLKGENAIVKNARSRLQIAYNYCMQEVDAK